jgi:hypothetical protein
VALAEEPQVQSVIESQKQNATTPQDCGVFYFVS